MPFFSHQGINLHFHEQGQGPALLLLHAFPLHGGSFRPQLEALSTHFRVLAPDHRGFGQSGIGPGPTEMSTLARDAFALLDSLSIREAVVLGVSMGGYAALAMLSEDAGRVAGLVLADTQAGADDEAGKQKREDTAQSILTHGVEVLATTLPERLLSSRSAGSVRSQVVEMIRAATPEGAAAASRGMGLRQDSSDVLSRFAGPTLVIVGEDDVVTPPAKAKALAALVPGARTVVIPGAGHLAHLEAPEAFNQALRAFLLPMRG
jgi:pimeloyl-ACP methyl ester carboxylesterase